jgi:calcineurin-like phosphoesterase family protein
MYPKLKIIVASLTRCGTQLTKTTIKKTRIVEGNHINFRRNNYPLMLDRQVYGCHSYPSVEQFKNLEHGTKILFLFGNPMNTVISLQKLNRKTAYANLNTNVNLHDKWHLEDVFRLENLFDSWYKSQPFIDILTVKYEALYEKNNIQKISDYLGIPMDYPDFRERQTNWNTHKYSTELVHTYKSLNEKILNADEVKYWSKLD